jgi:hypothetical protein
VQKGTVMEFDLAMVQRPQRQWRWTGRVARSGEEDYRFRLSATSG